jgi:hypothetical protein
LSQTVPDAAGFAERVAARVPGLVQVSSAVRVRAEDEKVGLLDPGIATLLIAT